ncbi:MAG TPA: EVE domain-containing protein [Bacteroidota bacterium]
MAFWLMKTEPSEFSYSDLEREKRAVWDGVTNNTALIHLRAMRKGDRALIYHSGGEKSLVGLADIVSDPYPDPKVGDAKVVVVDIAPAGRLSRPVPLGAIKKEKEFASFELVRISRLSVMPVSPALWKKLLAMAN